MSSIVASPDFITVVTNVGVFLAAAAATITAIWSAVKKIKTIGDDSQSSSSTPRAVAGMIMDNTTLIMWSESNRDVTEALREVHREMMELRFAVVQLKDTMK